MKNDAQRTQRATDDIAAKIRKLLADSRTAIQQKHQLTDEMISVANTLALHAVAQDFGLVPVADTTVKPA